MSLWEVSNSVDFSVLESFVLARWQRDHTFARSLARRRDAPRYVFLDGPPFATGLPHYGHVLTSFVKDVVPRYQTMRGFHVPRRWGWDCHGLPVELEVEFAARPGRRRDGGRLQRGVPRPGAALRRRVAGRDGAAGAVGRSRRRLPHDGRRLHRVGGVGVR
jgi:isoleucyl-tRNA synthetase